MSSNLNLNDGIDAFLKSLGSKDSVDMGTSANMLASVFDSTDSNKLETISGYFSHLMGYMKEFAQGKSNYQIEKFIAQENPTPAATFSQLLHQVRVLVPELMKDAVKIIETRRTIEYLWGKDGEEGSSEKREEPKMWSDGHGGDKLRWYDIDVAQAVISIQDDSLSMIDKLYQIQCFSQLLSNLEESNGKKFTREQYISEEPTYWDMRLMKQAVTQVLSKETGISAGQIDSMRIASSGPSEEDSFTSSIFGFVTDVASGRMDAAQLNSFNKKLLNDSSAIFGKDAKTQLDIQFEPKKLLTEELNNFGTSVTERPLN